MSSITFKPIIVKSNLRKDNTVPVYIRVYCNGASRRVPTNLVCYYPDDLTRSFQIKNKNILDKANELVKYMRSITSELNVFALSEMTVDDVVQFINKHGSIDVKNLTGYKRSEVQENPVVKSMQSITDGMKPCYVYLMFDSISHLHKIGISNRPGCREKTLQGQQPEINMLCAKQYPTRKIALIIERILHETYSDYHTRGEWYRLPEEAIEEIKVILG